MDLERRAERGGEALQSVERGVRLPRLDEIYAVLARSDLLGERLLGEAEIEPARQDKPSEFPPGAPLFVNPAKLRVVFERLLEVRLGVLLDLDGETLRPAEFPARLR